MNIVIPMAGRGSRFAQAGFTVPKPLIDVRGKPMYAWAVDSLPIHAARRLIFICQQEHLDDLRLAQDIRARYGDFELEIIGLDHVTEGQACTVLIAREFIDDDNPLLVFNADTFQRSDVLGVAERHPAAQGILTVFEAPGEKWSFARTDESGRVVETAEKRRISDFASTGLYYFSEGRTFVRLADEMVRADDRVNGEFYVAPVYNRLIDAGEDVRLDHADEVWVLGTPEDLAHFEKNYAASTT